MINKISSYFWKKITELIFLSKTLFKTIHISHVKILQTILKYKILSHRINNVVVFGEINLNFQQG